MKRTLLRNIFTDDFRMHNKKFKKIEEQVELVERHFPNLKSKVSEYACRKEAENKCMDKIVTILTNYARSETDGSSLKFGLAEFARILNRIGQHLEVLVVGLEKNVVQDLAEFKVCSKHLRSDLKAAVAAADYEANRQRQLQRLELLRDQEHERISAAEAELLKAKADSARATAGLEQHADIFEQKKLLGLRSALLTWTTLELRYHAKALELFTDAYNAAVEIDVDADLQEFRNKLQTGDPPARLATVQKTTRQHVETMLQRRQHEEPLLGGSPMGWSDAGGGHRSSSRQSTASSIGHMNGSR